MYLFLNVAIRPCFFCHGLSKNSRSQMLEAHVIAWYVVSILMLLLVYYISYMDMPDFVFHEDYVAAAYDVHFMYMMMFVTDCFIQIGRISDAIKTCFSSFCCVCTCAYSR